MFFLFQIMDPILLRQCAEALRDVVNVDVDSTEEFVRVAMENESLHPLLILMVNMRANRRSRVSWGTLLKQLSRGVFTRPAMSVLRCAYLVYQVLRFQAYPLTGRPRQTVPAIDIPERLAVEMMRMGVALPLTRSRVRIHVRAMQCMRELWELLATTGCVIWLDNFFKPRYVGNPAVGYATLNCSVMAVWATLLIPRTVPHDAELGWMLERRRERMQLVVDFATTTSSALRNVALQSDLTPLEVRVPLDTPRHGVTSIPWTPAMLTAVCVTSQLGMLEMIKVCADFCLRTRTGVAPLLTDVNLYYRMMRWLTGASTLRWDFPALLRCMPPLFGIWHAYKYCVQRLAREFHPLMVYLAQGTVDVGSHQATSPGLRSYELLLAAVLLTPAHLRKGFRVLARHHRQRWEEMQALVESNPENNTSLLLLI